MLQSSAAIVNGIPRLFNAHSNATGSHLTADRLSEDDGSRACVPYGQRSPIGIRACANLISMPGESPCIVECAALWGSPSSVTGITTACVHSARSAAVRRLWLALCGFARTRRYGGECDDRRVIHHRTRCGLPT